MAKISIRFNKQRGQRGSLDHVWRLFTEGNEYLFKHLKINVISESERDNEDWNITCIGVLTFDKTTSTAIINTE